MEDKCRASDLPRRDLPLLRRVEERRQRGSPCQQRLDQVRAADRARPGEAAINAAGTSGVAMCTRAESDAACTATGRAASEETLATSRLRLAPLGRGQAVAGPRTHRGHELPSVQVKQWHKRRTRFAIQLRHGHRCFRDASSTPAAAVNCQVDTRPPLCVTSAR